MTCCAVLQWTSSDCVQENLKTAQYLIEKAQKRGARLIVLPENFAYMGISGIKAPCVEILNQGPIQQFLSDMSLRFKIWIVGGTIPIKSNPTSQKYFATSLVYNDQGSCVGRYHKIHLFDVQLPNSQEKYFESEFIEAGDYPLIIDTPFGKLGIAVCYDLRFPELFRHLQKAGAEIIAVPAAFTYLTGLAHWEILIRARAIENQVYVLASAQTGLHANKRKTFGHSMIVNPWGEILTQLNDEAGVADAKIDLDYLHQLRTRFPVLTHKKIT